ncbi:MAG: c-type cytochrome [Gammaproteobacteria bacterium]
MKACLLWLNLLAAIPAAADESTIRLQDGAGKKTVAANCVTCHSLDYIPMHATVLDRQGWQKTVDKMVKSMGAPIKPEDIAPIVDYLSKQYGK